MNARFEPLPPPPAGADAEVTDGRPLPAADPPATDAPATDAWLEAAVRVTLVPAFTPRLWRRYRASGNPPGALLDRPDPGALAQALGLDAAAARRLARDLARADPRGEWERAAGAGVRLDGPDAPGWPTALDQLSDPPILLYRRGVLLDCDRHAVAVVGSRRASAYGIRIARTLAGDLARAGVTVVGGLARGVDVAAHEAALDAGGRTLAVLGSGLLEPYPPEHAGLIDRIARCGAVLTEFPLHAHPTRHAFPRRNRIIAALSLGVVVVEAAERSGALSTVRHALDLGRSVMAVPGPIDRDTSRGTLAMLRDGAAPVGSVEDVFAAVGWLEARRRALPEDERAVLDVLPEGGATAREVAAACGARVEVAAGLLVTLEVRGLVRREEGGRYAVR